MILIEYRQNAKGILTDLKADGHSEFMAKGKDPVCAAVSVLLGTSVKVLDEVLGSDFQWESTEGGNLSFQLQRLEGYREDELKGISRFLLTGLKALSLEYPDYVSIKLNS